MALAVVPCYSVHGVQDVPGLLPARQVAPPRHRLTLPPGLRLGMDSGWLQSGITGWRHFIWGLKLLLIGFTQVETNEQLTITIVDTEI